MKTIIGIAGKTHFIYSGQPDGEYICDEVMTYMEDMTDNEVRVYASHEGTSDPYPIHIDIIKAISKGAGFVLQTGHGNPFSWNTHKVEQGWTGGITTYGQMFFMNFKKLPVILVGGCHNAQFNVTWYQTRHSSDDDNKYYWTYDQGTPVSMCWEQVMLPWGGAIASIGNTGLGIGTSGGNPITLSHELEVNVFYQIGQNNVPTFGQAFGQALAKYIDENTIGNTDAHCITIYAPLGDPSLMFGGYE
jgi:hypothetical protein